VSRRTGRRKEISSTLNAGVNYLALYMITAHLSEYLGVETVTRRTGRG
jgi:hypothetical protein